MLNANIIYIYIYIYIYTQLKLNIMKNVSVFCHSFQKVKPIYYIDSLHRVKYFKPLFLEMLMIMAEMQTQNSVSQKM